MNRALLVSTPALPRASRSDMLHKCWLDSGLPHSRMKYNLCTERNKSLQSLQRSSFKSAAVLVRAAVSLQHSPLSAAHFLFTACEAGQSPPMRWCEAIQSDDESLESRRARMRLQDSCNRE